MSTAAPGEPSATSTRRNVLSGALLGVGFTGFVDEVVFHQLLHWHHFYDKSTPTAGLVSDGFFHAFSWFATIAALLLFADLRRRGAYHRRVWWGALLAGSGGFQLYDGVVQHKLLRLHQIRYDVDVAPYDWAWNTIAVALIVAGAALLLRARRRSVIAVAPARDDGSSAARRPGT